MSDLLHKKCVPCEGGAAPLTEKQAQEFLKSAEGWGLHFAPAPARVAKKFSFKNFKEVMAFLIKVGMLAEQEGHHPDIEAHYKEVTLTFTTHATSGLSENDFIMAAKVNKL